MKSILIMKKTVLLSLFFLSLTCKAYSTDIISVTSPAYCSDIQGNTTIYISALNFSQLTVYCWKQGDGFGTNSTVGTVTLDKNGTGSIVFPADQYPHGPVTVRISGTSRNNSDNCYLQLYNKGGVSWNESIPATPPAALGMNLVFSDDFTNLSIGDDGTNSTYYDHKPPHGWQDFSSIPFTSFNKSNNPFSQVDSYLRIRADANKNSTGLISSLKSDNTGFMVQAPCYFECRFMAPNAPGTWPAFWLLTVNQPSETDCDELDIIEAYGGEGNGEPNSKDLYQVTPHAWNQEGTATQLANDAFNSISPVSMNKFGIPSTWYEAPHTYGCKITKTETIYYCDNIEVGRHETLPVSKIRPFFFMINLATGGGWPVDLSRYNGLADMYVDYVRVYKDTVVVSVTGVNVLPTSATINIGSTQQLIGSVIPSNATNQGISWSSSDTNIATVNSNGLVTGEAAGTATITGTTQEGSYINTCAISVTSQHKLTGTVLGTSGSYDGSSTVDKAFDSNINTYVDNVTVGAWAGLDLGSKRSISLIRFYPRDGWASRMNGGKFQGSNTADFSSGVIDLYTLAATPPADWNEVTITNATTFRYVRYLSPANGYCNVAEIEFYANENTTAINEKRVVKINFYPNPATNLIHFTDNISEACIFSLQGQQLKSVHYSSSIDVSSLSKGLYIVQITDLNGNKSLNKLEIH